MKKVLATIAILLVALLSFAGCSSAVAPVNNVSVNSNAGSATDNAAAQQEMDKLLKEFLQIDPTVAERPNGSGGNRTYASASATAAAELLFKKYSDPAYSNLSVIKHEFKHVKDKPGYNIILRYKGSNTEGKQVVIGAAYDNGVGDPEKDTVGTASTAAMDNGTGVALVMYLAEYFSTVKPTLDFDVVLCFFAGAYGSAGSVRYLEDKMTPDERINTILMINVQRFGGDNIYIYSDEVKTPHNKYLLGKAEEMQLGYKPMPTNIALINQQYMSKVPYTHWGMIGDHAPFMQRDIPVANIFSGSLGGVSLSFNEKKGKANLSGTTDDVYTNLVAHRSIYLSQMAGVASFITTTLSGAGFSKTMVEAKQNMPSYSGATQTLWVSIGLIGLIVVLIVVLILLVKMFEKKYPYAPLVKKLKIAVFGMDYETQTENEIYVDIKKPRNPFDGY